MSGYERTYRPPRSLREHVGAEVTAWDLFRLEHDEQAGAWAASTLASVVASADAESAGALGCTECLDTGFYGAASPDDPDLLLTLVRRFGDSDLQSLTADGSWEAWGDGQALEVLDLETAADLAEAVTAGAGGLLRRYCRPRTFLPPTDSLSTRPLSTALAQAPADAWVAAAVVDATDPGAVFDLVRLTADATGPGRVDRWDVGGWVRDDALAGEVDPPVVLVTAPERVSALQAELRGLSGNAVCTCFPSGVLSSGPLVDAVSTDDSPAPVHPESGRVVTASRPGFQSSPSVLRARDGLHVGPLDAEPGLASSGSDMVDRQPLRNRTDLDLVHHSVHGAVPTVDADHPVPSPGDIPCPDDAIPEWFGPSQNALEQSGSGVRLGQRAVVPPAPVASATDAPGIDGLTASTGALTGQPPSAASALPALPADRPIDGGSAAARTCPVHGQWDLLGAGLPGVDLGRGADVLRRYWTVGKGAVKIRWNTPGDFRRCYRHLRKYMGLRAKGYCAIRHKVATGVWPGSRFNVGRRGGLLSSASPEVALLAALRSGRVSGDTEGKTTMPDTLTDGVYTETDSQIDALLAAIEAKTIPVAAPDNWFDDPKLDRPTTVTVTDEGRVYGHIAPWGVTHIGMAGAVTAPKNPDGKYAYFRTGQYVTASGKSVRVGQFTLTGGHAPMEANVASVVKHYDDTQQRRRGRRGRGGASMGSGLRVYCGRPSLPSRSGSCVRRRHPGTGGESTASWSSSQPVTSMSKASLLPPAPTMRAPSRLWWRRAPGRWLSWV